MAIIPGGQQIRTNSSDVDLTNRGNALTKAQNAVYTMDDIIETVGGGSGSGASSFVKISQSGTGNPSLSFISNDAEIALASDTRIGVGRYRFTFSSAPAENEVMVVLPGGVKTGEWDVVSLFSTYEVTGGTGTLIIESYGITNTNLLQPADIGFGGNNSIIVEIKVFS